MIIIANSYQLASQQGSLDLASSNIRQGWQQALRQSHNSCMGVALTTRSSRSACNTILDIWTTDLNSNGTILRSRVYTHKGNVTTFLYFWKFSSAVTSKRFVWLICFWGYVFFVKYFCSPFTNNQNGTDWYIIRKKQYRHFFCKLQMCGFRSRLHWYSRFRKRNVLDTTGFKLTLHHFKDVAAYIENIQDCLAFYFGD